MRRCNSCPAWVGCRDLEYYHESSSTEFQKEPGYFMYYHNQRQRNPCLPMPLTKSHFPGFTPLFTGNPQLSLDLPASFGEADAARPSFMDIKPAHSRASRARHSAPQTFTHDPYRWASCPRRMGCGLAPLPAPSSSSEDDPGEEIIGGLPSICQALAKGLCGGALLALHISRAIKLPFDIECREPVTPTTDAPEDDGRKVSCAFSLDVGTDECPSEWDETQSNVADYFGRQVVCDVTWLATRHPNLYRLAPLAPPLVPQVLDQRVLFLTHPLPEACGVVHCVVRRERRRGETRYLMSLQIPPHPTKVVDGAGREFIDCNLAKSTETFLCGAKRVRGSPGFAISASPDDFDPKGPAVVGQCRRVGRGTAFALQAVDVSGPGPRQVELAAVEIDHVFPDRPPQVTATLCGGDRSAPRRTLRNTRPLWNGSRDAYEVDFGPRVRLASSKNLQLEEASHGKAIVRLTFGQLEEGLHCLDFAHPFSPAQALAVALASFACL